MSWYRQRSMKGSWLQLVIGVLDIVIALDIPWCNADGVCNAGFHTGGN